MKKVILIILCSIISTNSFAFKNKGDVADCDVKTKTPRYYACCYNEYWQLPLWVKSKNKVKKYKEWVSTCSTANAYNTDGCELDTTSVFNNMTERLSSKKCTVRNIFYD